MNLFVPMQITNHLFEEEGKGFGMDLVALNLQRGRDHGNILYPNLDGSYWVLIGCL